MGILSGKDLLSNKYVTAEITDSEDRIHYVPIRHTVGDYFLAEIENKLYAFSLKGARHLTHRKTLSKSFRVIQYDTSNFKSLKPETKELEMMLRENGLPKMNRMMHNIFTQLGKRERNDFKEHDIEELMKAFHDQNKMNPAAIQPIIEYLEELDIKKIVTPVRRITDFIQEDLIATQPSFLAELLPMYKRLDVEHRKITNTPIKATGNIMKVMMIVMIIGIAGVGGYLAYDNGVFDGITEFTGNISTIGEGLGGLPSPTQGIQTQTSADYSDAAIQAKYPEPQDLVDAINRGEVDYNKLSSTMKTYVDGLK